MDAAIGSYTKALEMDPHSAELAGLLGKLYYVQGNNTLALEFLGFAIDLATEDVLQLSLSLSPTSTCSE